MRYKYEKIITLSIPDASKLFDVPKNKMLDKIVGHIWDADQLDLNFFTPLSEFKFINIFTWEVKSNNELFSYFKDYSLQLAEIKKEVNEKKRHSSSGSRRFYHMNNVFLKLFNTASKILGPPIVRSDPDGFACHWDIRRTGERSRFTTRITLVDDMALPNNVFILDSSHQFRLYYWELELLLNSEFFHKGQI